MMRCLRFVLVATVLLGAVAPAPAASYSILDMNNWVLSSQGLGINACGQVVGNCTPSWGLGGTHGFLPTAGPIGLVWSASSSSTAVNDSGFFTGSQTWNPATGYVSAYRSNAYGWLVPLGTLGGTWSNGYGINNKDYGQVVGDSAIASGAYHAFLWTEGVGMLDLGTLGGSNSVADAINDNQQVAGFSDTADGKEHAFLWTASDGMSDLGTLGGNTSDAYGINASGQVVGGSDVSGSVYHAFLWTEGAGMSDLSTLGGTNSSAFGINNLGQIVGESGTASGADHAFLYSDGKMTDLNSLLPDGSGWTLERARGINDSGQIVGTGILGGVEHAFLMTPQANPVPEPSVLAALSGMAAVLAASLLRRRGRAERKLPGGEGPTEQV